MNAIQSKKKVMEIYGFMHIYMVNNWREIVEGQVSKMKVSGLWDKLSSLLVGYIDNGVNQETPDFFNEEKVSILYQSKDPTIYESLTLSNLHYISEQKEGVVFYIHTKGVTHLGNPFQLDWREMMEYFMLERYELCLEELKHTDIVGTNWHFGEGYLGARKKFSGGVPITPHFSGNFWWANTSYIRRLPNLIPIQGRHDCEFWIGRAFPKVSELWGMKTSPHKTLCPPDLYRGKENIKHIKTRLPNA